MRPSHRQLSTSPPSSGPVESSGKGKISSGGAFDALEHTGIPKSWLRRPRLPSRNWLIFWGAVTSLSCLYWHDRWECRLIKEEYIARVRHLSEVPLDSKELPRRVDVYACKWPGDEEHDRSLKFFKRYVKPILVAAAVDYAPKNGNQYGAISDLVRDKAKDQRREQLGIHPPRSPWQPTAANSDREKDYERWVQGGIVIVGRHTFKEYMHGLQRGWTESLEKIDEEEAFANRLSEDGRFDEPDEVPPAEFISDDTPANIPSLPQPPNNPPPTPQPKSPPSALFAPFGEMRKPPQPRHTPFQQGATLLPDVPPQFIPQHPPLLLVYYPNRLGFLNIPLIIADFFNERKNVRIGCEAAYKLIMNESRPLVPPVSTTSARDPASSSLLPEGSPPGAIGHGGDLDFALDSEADFGSSFAKLPGTIAKARESYYSELPAKLKLARELARGDREPTKDEQAFPPPTEVELRAQRLSKEKRWTSDEQACIWLRAGSGVVWDDRFKGALKVFDTPANTTTQDIGEGSVQSDALSPSSNPK